jgi:hypothetical protein
MKESHIGNGVASRTAQVRRSDIRRADGKHARYYWLLLAESHLTRRLFGSVLHRIAALPSPAG